MRTSTTIALIILTLGIGAYVYFVDSEKESTTERAAKAGRLNIFEKEDINGIHVTTPQGNISLSRTDASTWHFSAPFEDRAAPKWIDSLLDTALEMKSIDSANPDEFKTKDSALEATGFGPGRMTVKITSSSGETSDFIIGNRAALNQCTYVITGTEPTPKSPILVVRGDLRTIFESDSNTWRDATIFRANLDDATIFTYTSPSGEIEIKRPDKDAFWHFARPLQTRADSKIINGILTRMTKSKIVSFPSPTTTSSNGGSTTAPPESAAKLTVSFAPKTQQPYSIEIWPDPNLTPETPDDAKIAWARFSDRPGTFAVDPELLRLLNLSVNSLRDPMLARIDPTAIVGIDLEENDQTKVRLRRRGQRWILSRLGQQEFANLDRITKLFRDLNEHQIIDFVSDTAASLEAYGLDKPFLKLHLIGRPPTDAPTDSEDHENRVALLLGAVDNKLYANYEGEPFVYRVGPDLLTPLATDAIKWKSLSLLNFSVFSLRGLTITQGANPPLELRYDPRFAKWNAITGNKNITEILEPNAAEILATKLASLSVSDWTIDRARGFAALRNPSLTVRIIIEQMKADRSGTEPHPIDLSFAPAGNTTTENAVYFYGRIQSVPEVFLIRRSLYEELAGKYLLKKTKPNTPTP